MNKEPAGDGKISDDEGEGCRKTSFRKPQCDKNNGDDKELGEDVDEGSVDIGGGENKPFNGHQQCEDDKGPGNPCSEKCIFISE
ncbi:hypothetical protein [Methanovulcanius yangii]|uniref:hypothetical protein n=1 Tax=Methanovulcanius yangii TaxID=1789227 RepID=UPI0029C9CA13|nr:hypothetical protein [Methanovulcanius yangii]